MTIENQFKNLETAARDACAASGVDYKDVPADGRFHSANLTDDHRGRGDGRIKIFPDRQGGIVWNHKTGEQKAFFIDHKGGIAINAEERERIKAEQERRHQEQRCRHNKTAQRALDIWQAAKVAPLEHPYVLKKRINPYGARAADWHRTIKGPDGKHQKLIIENALLIPLYNEQGKLRNLQAIFPMEPPELGRGKDFLPGGELSGMFWWIGEKSDPVCIAEGFATAATLHQETGHRVYIAFTANNLLAVGRIVRKHLADVKIIFCADNDLNTNNNPGLTKANEAAAAIGGFVAFPPIAGDFNDYYIQTQGPR
ncbi:MAG: toprim domain-containing protein [Methylobacter sp.]|uniref:toprim domain-containing protein n=1 Tax=Methylobacter sp. TaxID=2051955 RepID=UPI002588BBBC|nr:toprim domain-containing protein [Methylobacter sp.]MCL7419799.1 toprim domain-containing protein [Methylobacter sp.]